MFFGFRPNITFLGGAILVNVAMYIYASYPFVAKAASGLTSSNTSSPTNRDEVDSLESQSKCSVGMMGCMCASVMGIVVWMCGIFMMHT